MGSAPEGPAPTAVPASPHTGRLFAWPTSKAGWWAIGLGAVFVVLFLVNSFVFMPSKVEIPWRQAVGPFYAVGMLACGLSAGIVGLTAVIRCRERSWLIWLTLLPGILVLTLVLGEFLVPH